MRRISASLVLALLGVAAVGTQTPRIQVVPHAVAPRVDISIDGKPFTSYIFERSQKKPSLFPVRSAKGAVVTRGYPLEPKPGDRIDHPHHIGLWFNYGDVNGLDFWNNSDAITGERAARMGTVVHQRVVEAVSGKDKGELNVEMDWVDVKGTILLKENTRYVFQGDGTTRVVDRITRLAALKEPVVLGDNKEGLLGIRMARALELPSKSADVFLDANNKPAARAVNNEGVTGNYVGSDGKTGDAVWSTRGPWMMLQGKIGEEAVTVSILDHPDNPGFPTVWHARGYGLFAANNLGQKAFDPKQEEARRTIAPGESMTFRHRVMIIDGTPDVAQMTAEQRKFAAQK